MPFFGRPHCAEEEEEEEKCQQALLPEQLVKRNFVNWLTLFISNSFIHLSDFVVFSFFDRLTDCSIHLVEMLLCKQFTGYVVYLVFIY